MESIKSTEPIVFIALVLLGLVSCILPELDLVPFPAIGRFDPLNKQSPSFQKMGVEFPGCPGTRRFNKIDLDSRFLYDSLGRLENLTEADKLCKTDQVEVARITSLSDLFMINKIFKDMPSIMSKNNYSIGIKVFNETDYVDVVTEKPIKFQAFMDAPGNLTELDGDKKCVVLRKSAEFQKFVMEQANCHSAVSVLCQHSDSHPCFRQTLESIMKPNNTLEFLSFSKNGFYLISNFQLSFSEAKSFCTFKNMTIGLYHGLRYKAFEAVKRWFVKSRDTGDIYWKPYIWGAGQENSRTCIGLKTKGEFPEYAKVLCSTPRYFICHDKARDKKKCTPNLKKGFKISAYRSNTKFIHLPHHPKGTWKDAKKACHDSGYDMVEIRSHEDYKSLKQLLIDHNFASNAVALGVHRMRNDFHFFEEDGITPISHQYFHLGGPTYKMNGTKQCVAAYLETLGINGKEILFQKEKPCDDRDFLFMCQFKQEFDDCYSKSLEELERNDQSSDLRFLHRISSRNIFMSLKQKNWQEARKICFNHGMDLLDYANPSISITVQKFHEKWIEQMAEMDIPYIATFWTSGKFQDPYNTAWKSFAWMNKNIQVKQKSIAKAMKFPTEPESRISICLSFGHEKKTNRHFLRNIFDVDYFQPKFKLENCLLPHFFFCSRITTMRSDEGLESEEGEDDLEITKTTPPSMKKHEFVGNAQISCVDFPSHEWLRAGRNSKYLMRKNYQSYQNQINQLCSGHGLSMAEVSGPDDLVSLKNFAEANRLHNKSWAIRLKDLNTSENFTILDTGASIKFQVLHFPKSIIQQGTCGHLEIDLSGKLTMGLTEKKSCRSEKFNALCQFRKDSKCFKNSDENQKALSRGNSISYFGDSKSRWYFVGDVQRTWKDASKFCQNYGMQLIDFDETEKIDFSLFYRSWIRKLGIQDKWTFWSGYLDESKANKKNRYNFLTYSNTTALDYQTWKLHSKHIMKATSSVNKSCIPVDVSESARKREPENCLLPKYFLCYKDVPFFLNGRCDLIGPFLKKRLNSRFFMGQNRSRLTYDEVKNTCEKWGYEMVSIKSMIDVRSLLEYFQDSRYVQSFFIGANNLNMQEELMEYDRMTPIQFQIFDESYPKWDNKKRCIALSIRLGEETPEIYTTNTVCDSFLDIICQFREDSYCDKNSIENVVHQYEKKQLYFLHDEIPQRLYASNFQIPWEKAKDYCISKGMVLYRLAESRSKIQQLIHSLGKYVINEKLPSQIHFWTSGKILAQNKELHIFWHGTSKVSLPAMKLPDWDWTKPLKQESFLYFEECIGISAKNRSGKIIVDPTSCKLPQYFICTDQSPYLKNCDVPPEEKQRFFKLYHGSKYILLDSKKKQKYQDIAEQCENWGLEMAEISSFQDYISLATVFNDNRYDKENFLLGLNSVVKWGDFRQSDGATPIQFQMFPRGYAEHDGRYISLERGASRYWTMLPVSNPTSLVMCQYKRSTDCYLKSSENKALETRPTEFQYLGSSKKRIYFIGNQQKTWSESIRSCWTYESKLIEFSMKEEENQHLFYFLFDWAKELSKKINVLQNALTKPIFDISVWSSGKFVNDPNENEFRWETNGSVYFNLTRRDVLWTWAIHEPNSRFIDVKELCISFGVFYKQAGTGKIVPTLSADICDIPNYYICFKERAMKHNMEITDPTFSKIKQKLLKDSSATKSSVVYATPKLPCFLLPEIYTKWLHVIRPPGIMICK